jgi:hypothetical protein
VSDDVHLLSDLHAVVQRNNETAGPALLYITSLSPHAPFTLVNVSLGDAGIIADRACGCPLESIGWQRHLHTIRSVEKLTAGGSNFLDVDIIRILEEKLPQRFGGSALDYQLVEHEQPDGRSRIELVVAPRVGEVDAAELAHFFLDEVGSGGGAEHLMTRVWTELNALEVQRRELHTTPSGKVLHVFKRWT